MAAGGEEAHTFFFSGFPGTGKSHLAELVAPALHGHSAPPHYQKFAMGNYKTDEDLWKLVSPPCGVKGEGAAAAGGGGGSGGGGGGGSGGGGAGAVADVGGRNRRRETEFGWSGIGFTEVKDRAVRRTVSEQPLKDQD